MRFRFLVAGTALALGCTEQGPSPVRYAETVDAVVVDGTTDGHAGFFFLPPIGEPGAALGAFDASALSELEVRVCLLAGATCGSTIATFAATDQAGGITVDRESGHYAVDWHTADHALDPDRDVRIGVHLGSRELGYADIDVRPGGSPGGGLQPGMILPIRFHTSLAATTAVTITERQDLGALLFGIGVDVDRPVEVTVEYWTDAGPRLQVSRSAGNTEDVLLARLRGDAEYEYLVRVRVDDLEIAEHTGSFRTDPLPEDLSAITLTTTGRSTAPLTMLELRQPTFQGFAALDQDSRWVWYYRTSGAPWGWARRADGNFVFLDTQDHLAIVTPTRGVVAELHNADVGGEVIHHDVVPTRANTLYVMTRHPQTVDGQTWVGEMLWEWDPEAGTVEQRWNAFDFLSPDTDVGPRTRTGDWLHGNSLHVTAQGYILMSLQFLDQVVAITPDFSRVAWRLGGPNPTFELSFDATFSGQHTAAEVDVDRVLLFDNRQERHDGETYSRALEIELDHSSGTAGRAWDFRPPNDNYSAIISSARRLDNGNTMVAFGAGPGLRGSIGPIEVYEVTADGTVVWNLIVEGPAHLYRATPFPSIAGETVVTEQASHLH